MRSLPQLIQQLLFSVFVELSTPDGADHAISSHTINVGVPAILSPGPLCAERQRVAQEPALQRVLGDSVDQFQARVCISVEFNLDRGCIDGELRCPISVFR
jgi:hypothetical protein